MPKLKVFESNEMAFRKKKVQSYRRSEAEWIRSSCVILGVLGRMCLPLRINHTVLDSGEHGKA